MPSAAAVQYGDRIYPPPATSCAAADALPRCGSHRNPRAGYLGRLRCAGGSVRTSPAAAAAGGLKAPNSAPTTACWARCCRARQAMGSQAAVTEASSLSVRMTWQRWHSMRSATPRPPPSVSVLTPLRELRGTFSPERLGAIQPLFDAAQCLIGVHCAAPKRQRLRWSRWVGKGDRNFRMVVFTSEHFVHFLSELRVKRLVR